MHYRYDNVITLRTFSKAYGLAGVRIGYGFAHENLIANLLKVKLPFEPSSLAEAAGIAALSDREFLHRTLETNARGLRFVTGEFREMGVQFVPSEANFILTLWPSAEAANDVVESLLRNGIIVRPMAAFGVPNGVRISIGSDEENEMLIAAMRKAVPIQELVLCS
jgi:histidinol-phosphate aminotransferase